MSHWFYIEFKKQVFFSVHWMTCFARRAFSVKLQRGHQFSRHDQLWPSRVFTSELWWIQPITTVNVIQNQERELNSFNFNFFNFLILSFAFNLFYWLDKTCLKQAIRYVPSARHFTDLESCLDWGTPTFSACQCTGCQWWRCSALCGSADTSWNEQTANEVKGGDVHTHVLRWHFSEQPYSKWGQGWRRAYTCATSTLLGTTIQQMRSRVETRIHMCYVDTSRNNHTANEAKGGDVHTHVLRRHFSEVYSKWGTSRKGEDIHTHVLSWQFLEQQEQMRSRLDTCVHMYYADTSWSNHTANEVKAGHMHTHVVCTMLTLFGTTIQQTEVKAGYTCAYACATLTLPGATQANEVTDEHEHTHVLSWHLLE